MEDIYLFSFSNVGYLDYARHSLLSLQRVGLLKYFTYFCLDDEIYQRLLDDNLGFKPEKNQNYKEVEGPFVVKHTDYLEWEPTKERYEYFRQGLKWDTLLENMITFKRLRDKKLDRPTKMNYAGVASSNSTFITARMCETIENKMDVPEIKK